MKRNLNYLALTALSILTVFGSCSGDGGDGDVNSGDYKSMLFKITNAPATYAESTPTGGVVAFGSGVLYFVNSAGVIVDRYAISTAATNLPGKVINLGGVTGAAGVKITNLNPTITAAHIVGNVPSGVEALLPTTGNISAVRNYALGVDTQGDATGRIANVNLYGTAALVRVGTTNEYTCTVPLAPTVARLELTDVKGGPTITQFKVDGIFVDNYHPSGTIAGTASGSLTNAGTANANFTDNSPVYTTALKGAVYDWYTSGLAATGTVPNVTAKPAGANALWGYNLFANPASATATVVPRIIIRLSGIQTNNGVAYPNNFYYVTIRGLREGGNSLARIESGKIYRFASGVLTIDDSNITPTPNETPINVEVKVTLANWTVVNVTPEI